MAESDHRVVERTYMKTHTLRSTLVEGFTLLELLVVIAVAAILVSIAAASYTSAQQKARDARRSGDMHAVQNAAEQYYADNNAVYPANSSSFGTSYLPAGFPTEPKPAPYQAYVYTHIASPEGYCSCSQVEVPKGNATNMSCAGFGTSGTQYYCVKNLQ